jgi:hypothetical protein
MAEPAGLLFEAQIDEKAMAAFMRTPVMNNGRRESVGQPLARMADEGEPDGDIVIVHHDGERGQLFLACVFNHFSMELLEPLWPALEALAARLAPQAEARGAIATVFPQAYGTVDIVDGRLMRAAAPYPPPAALEALVQRLNDRLFSFERKGGLPEPARSMRLRGYQCKPFRSAWRAYLKRRDLEERPAKIAAATREAPLHLVHDVFC